MAERDDEQVLLDQLESSPEPNATPTVAPAEPVPVSNGHGDRDEFQQLFDQWDAEQQNPAEQPPAAEPAQEVLSPDNLDELLARFDREQAELEHQRLREAADPMLQQENAALLERMEAARQAYQREVDLAEFDRIGTELGKDLREEFPYLPESFVTAKLYQLAMTEQVLVQAFDNRRQNPRYFQHCMHLVRQALRKSGEHSGSSTICRPGTGRAGGTRWQPRQALCRGSTAAIWRAIKR